MQKNIIKVGAKKFVSLTRFLLYDKFFSSRGLYLERSCLANFSQILSFVTTYKKKRWLNEYIYFRRKSEEVKERNILKIRRRSHTELSPEDSAKRRSSRAIKRRKFDDELGLSSSLLVVSPGITIIEILVNWQKSN